MTCRIYRGMGGQGGAMGSKGGGKVEEVDEAPRGDRRVENEKIEIQMCEEGKSCQRWRRRLKGK